MPEVTADLTVCPLCGWWGPGFGPGPNGRPRACCPGCGSLERHRFLALLLTVMIDPAARPSCVLDVAPMKAVAELLREASPGRYVSIDVDPAADRRSVTVVGSLTALPLVADSVDLMLCYHVLEHVPDDRAAMREIARVLGPVGLGLVQVPWRPGPTDQDPGLPPEVRAIRFGQADHVRYYGDDFVSRLAEAGVRTQVVTPQQLLPADLLRAFGLVADEQVWLACRTGSSLVLPGPDELAGRIPAALSALADREVAREDDARLTRAERQRDSARSRARRWRRRHRQLRSRFLVRVAMRLSPGEESRAHGGSSRDSR